MANAPQIENSAASGLPTGTQTKSGGTGGSGNAMGGGSASVNLPTREYTMPSNQIDHFINEKDLEVIESGGHSKLLGLSLTAFGAAVGFLQNIFVMVDNIISNKVPTIWTLVGSVFFVAFIVGAICLYISNRKQRTPLKKLIDEIKQRPTTPFEPKSS